MEGIKRLILFRMDPTNFFPVNSTNVGLSPKTLLPHLHKVSRQCLSASPKLLNLNQ